MELRTPEALRLGRRDALDQAAIGQAQLLSHATLEVAHLTLPARQLEKEVSRFESAVDCVRNELDELRNEMAESAAEMRAFIDVHALILQDPELVT